ncbi:HNH endonuclease, partial [Streptomyces sp. UG1]|uniref:HNH endonuclease n=1 Tax=Streptomyces sp. UG1 TaxID=3417652 RepID=UPI003CEF5226
AKTHRHTPPAHPLTLIGYTTSRDAICADGQQQCARCERNQEQRTYAAARAQILADDPHCAYCVYCGERVTHADHIIPRARGGTHAREHLAAACQDCNTSKGNLTPYEWLQCLEGGLRKAKIPRPLT